MQQSPITTIEPPKGWARIDFSEIWRARELFRFLVWRDVKIKYKQTLLGIGWAVLGPLASTIIFTLIFGKLANLATDGLPQPIFYMCGLVIWRYFEQAVANSSNSLVANQVLLTKIYLPRLIIPVSSVVGQLVDFAIGLLLLLKGLLIAFQNWPTVPPALLLYNYFRQHSKLYRFLAKDSAARTQIDRGPNADQTRRKRGLNAD